jgi:hypothetical protein
LAGGLVSDTKLEAFLLGESLAEGGQGKRSFAFGTFFQSDSNEVCSEPEDNAAMTATVRNRATCELVIKALNNFFSQALTVFATTNSAATICAFAIQPGHVVNHDQGFCGVSSGAPTFFFAAFTGAAPFIPVLLRHKSLLPSVRAVVISGKIVRSNLVRLL